MAAQSQAYLLGQVLAVLGQHSALATDEHRAYQLASSSPRPVIVPALSRLSEEGREAITPIMAGIAVIPVQLAAPEQADFALGYYHELARRKTVNTAIKARRDALGMTQVDFADAIGVSVRTLQNWEQAHRKPRMSSMVVEAIERLESDHAAPAQAATTA